MKVKINKTSKKRIGLGTLLYAEETTKRRTRKHTNIPKGFSLHCCFRACTSATVKLTDNGDDRDNNYDNVNNNSSSRDDNSKGGSNVNSHSKYSDIDNANAMEVITAALMKVHEEAIQRKGIWRIFFVCFVVLPFVVPSASCST